MQRKVLRQGGLDLLEGFIKRQWVWDQKVDGEDAMDVAGGPVVHTETCCLLGFSSKGSWKQLGRGC